MPRQQRVLSVTPLICVLPGCLASKHVRDRLIHIDVLKATRSSMPQAAYAANF